jgi:diguanylate cyclase (GGDEF)-like protein
VEQRTAELRDANQRLSELAMTDPLTQILNRRAFFQKFQEELDRVGRYKHPLAVAMLDVDHFKDFNDREGHVAGDEALKKLTQVSLANLRKTDLLARYGGEEFVVMMPETRVKAGLEICERLRLALENTVFEGSNKKEKLTVSLGVAGFPADGQTSEALIQAADQALYRAKQSGRNRVVSFSHASVSSS